MPPTERRDISSMMRILLPALLAVALTTAALISFAWNADGTTPGIIVTQAWARATPPGARTGAVYITLENRGSTPDRLVSITTPAANSTMMHETIEEDGISQMREIDGDIAPGATLEMQPGGAHIMLMSLAGPLKEGETVSLTLDFENAEDVTVEAKVSPIGADGPVE
jgi:periplasmic copper chaperone A